MYISFNVKYLLFLSDFNVTWTFSPDFEKNPHISNFMKIRPLGSRAVPCGQTETRNEAKYSPVAILRTRLKTANNGVFVYLHMQAEAEVFKRIFVAVSGSSDVSPNAQLHCLQFVSVRSFTIQRGLAVCRLVF